jgi:tetratricopeptide (TPR) repeat protein
MCRLVRKNGVAVLALILMLGLVLPIMAQNRIVKGKVQDEKGNPIKGATVLIQGTDVKREYKVQTDKKGEYFYMGIPFGEYRIIVRAQGFAPDYVRNVKPSISAETENNFTLKAGPDHKLDFELTTDERQRLQQDAEKAQKQRQSAAEVKANFDAGLTLAQQGKYDEAVEAYKKALEKDPDQPYVLANMADALAKGNKLPEALAAYEKAISMKSDDPSIYQNMGVLLGKMGKTAESQEAFKKAASMAAAMNPAAAAQNYYNMGATLVNSGKAAEAAEAFKQAIAADANFAEAYYQLGICLSSNQATIPDAIKSLQKYVEISKNAEQVEVAKQIITALQSQTSGFKAEKDSKKKP